MKNVSLTLQNTSDARPIIDAIVADNPSAVIIDMPAMIKIDCPQKLVVNASSVSERLGRDWDPQEIHLSIISLSGNLDEEDEYFELSWN